MIGNKLQDNDNDNDNDDDDDDGDHWPLFTSIVPSTIQRAELSNRRRVTSSNSKNTIQRRNQPKPMSNEHHSSQQQSCPTTVCTKTKPKINRTQNYQHNRQLSTAQLNKRQTTNSKLALIFGPLWLLIIPSQQVQSSGPTTSLADSWRRPALRSVVQSSELSLEYLQLRSVPSSQFCLQTNWHQINSLSLAQNQIVEINSNAFSCVGLRLKILNLRRNKIEQISTDAFKQLDQLQVLLLDGNQLHRIPSEPLNLVANSLRHLNLANNQIDSIEDEKEQEQETTREEKSPTKPFGDNRKRNNRQQTINLRTNKLISLNLKGNPLRRLAAGAFRQLNKLRTLILTETQLVLGQLAPNGPSRREPTLATEGPKQQPSQANDNSLATASSPFIGLEQLRFLHLDRLVPPQQQQVVVVAVDADNKNNNNNTNLTSLGRDFCHHSPRLASLLLRSNGIAQIPQFSNCQSLVLLDLAHNQISGHLDGGRLVGQPHLIDLYLGHNRIESLGVGAFSGLISLQLLELNNNQLKFIHPRAFASLGNTLIELNLAHNYQLTWVPSIGLERLLSIKLFGNAQLRQLPHFPGAKSLVLTYAYHCCDYTTKCGSDSNSTTTTTSSKAAPSSQAAFAVGQLAGSLAARWRQFWGGSGGHRRPDTMLANGDGEIGAESGESQPAGGGGDLEAERQNLLRANDLSNLTELVIWPPQTRPPPLESPRFKRNTDQEFNSSAEVDGVVAAAAAAAARRLRVGANLIDEPVRLYLVEIRRQQGGANLQQTSASPTATTTIINAPSEQPPNQLELWLGGELDLAAPDEIGQRQRKLAVQTGTVRHRRSNDVTPPQPQPPPPPPPTTTTTTIGANSEQPTQMQQQPQTLITSHQHSGESEPGHDSLVTVAAHAHGDGNDDDCAISCLPRPNSFTPCQDLFDSWWLRASIWLVFASAFLGNISVIIVLTSVRSSSSSSALTSIMWLAGHSRRHIDVPRFLVINLAIADLLMAIYLGLLACVDLATLGEFKFYAIKWQYSTGCQLAGFLAVLSSELSVFILAIITLERNYAITNAVHLNRRLSLQKAMFIMLVGYSFAFVMAALPLNGISDYRKFSSICLPLDAESNLASRYYVITLISINTFSFVLLLSCYLRMYCAIRGSQAWNTNDLRIAKRMSILVATDFLCWMPIIFVACFALINPNDQLPIGPKGLKVLTIFILPLNSVANPFLYAITTKKFKRDLQTLKRRLGSWFMLLISVFCRCCPSSCCSSSETISRSEYHTCKSHNQYAQNNQLHHRKCDLHNSKKLDNHNLKRGGSRSLMVIQESQKIYRKNLLSTATATAAAAAAASDGRQQPKPKQQQATQILIKKNGKSYQIGAHYSAAADNNNRRSQRANKLLATTSARQPFILDNPTSTSNNHNLVGTNNKRLQSSFMLDQLVTSCREPATVNRTTTLNGPQCSCCSPRSLRQVAIQVKLDSPSSESSATGPGEIAAPAAEAYNSSLLVDHNDRHELAAPQPPVGTATSQPTIVLDTIEPPPPIDVALIPLNVISSRRANVSPSQAAHRCITKLFVDQQQFQRAPESQLSSAANDVSDLISGGQTLDCSSNTDCHRLASCQSAILVPATGCTPSGQFDHDDDDDNQVGPRSASACAYHWPTTATATATAKQTKPTHSKRRVPAHQQAATPNPNQNHCHSVSQQQLRMSPDGSQSSGSAHKPHQHQHQNQNQQRPQQLMAGASSWRSINRLILSPVAKTWSSIQISLQSSSKVNIDGAGGGGGGGVQNNPAAIINIDQTSSDLNDEDDGDGVKQAIGAPASCSTTTATSTAPTNSTYANDLEHFLPLDQGDILQLSSPAKRHLLRNNERRMSRSCELITKQTRASLVIDSDDATTTTTISNTADSSGFYHADCDDDKRILLATIKRLTGHRQRQQQAAAKQQQQQANVVSSSLTPTSRRNRCTRCRSWSPALLDKLEDCMYQIRSRIPNFNFGHTKQQLQQHQQLYDKGTLEPESCGDPSPSCGGKPATPPSLGDDDNHNGPAKSRSHQANDSSHSTSATSSPPSTHDGHHYRRRSPSEAAAALCSEDDEISEQDADDDDDEFNEDHRLGHLINQQQQNRHRQLHMLPNSTQQQQFGNMTTRMQTDRHHGSVRRKSRSRWRQKQSSTTSDTISIRTARTILTSDSSASIPTAPQSIMSLNHEHDDNDDNDDLPSSPEKKH